MKTPMLPVRNAAYAATFVSEGSVGEICSDFKAEGSEVYRTRIAKRVALPCPWMRSGVQLELLRYVSTF
jgi:hypothetical protein